MFRIPRGFWNGFLSAFQLFPTRGYTPPPPRPSDAEAIHGYWRRVGGYMSHAMNNDPEIKRHDAQ